MAINSCNQAYYDQIKGDRDAKQYQKDVMTNQIAELTAQSDQLACQIDAANEILAAIEGDITQFPTVTGFSATWSGDDVHLTWDDMGSSATYLIQRSTEGGEAFTSTVEVYNDVYTSLVTLTGLPFGTTQYFRIKAVASGYAMSEWAYDSAVPAA